MRRIAVSQRVDQPAAYPERRDALDQGWCTLLEALGCCPVPLPNGLRAPQDWARALQIDALLLTGGNDVDDPSAQGPTAPERDRSERALLALAQAAHWPVLGVCRGFQLLNLHLGGQLVPVAGHVAVRHRLHHAGPARLPGLDDGREVNSFHRLGIAAAGLAPALQPLLQDAHGHIEAAAHHQVRWAGIMWHPEREPALQAADRHLLHHLFCTP